MNCYNCGGTYREITDTLEINDDYVGSIYVEGASYYICENCRDILYTEEMAQAIEKARDNRIQELLGDLPLRNFVSASETASLLKISRQALNKNRRISNGFIYHTKIGNFTVFLRQSVLRFIKTSDGRFPLYSSSKLAPFSKYLEPFNDIIFSRHHLFNKAMTSYRPQSFEDYSSLKESSYAKQ